MLSTKEFVVWLLAWGFSKLALAGLFYYLGLVAVATAALSSVALLAIVASVGIGVVVWRRRNGRK